MLALGLTCWQPAVEPTTEPTTEPAATLRFAFDRPAADTHYEFILHPDGSGTFHNTYPPVPPATPGETVDAPLHLLPATAARIFDQLRATNSLRGCETRAKNIANTGTKTLTYTPASGVPVSCTWNYTERVAVQSLQDEFMGMALTLDLGRAIRLKQRYDRLALDREMGFLYDAVKEKRARGVRNIAPTLQAIVADDSLLERVRSRAAQLLEQSQTAD